MSFMPILHNSQVKFRFRCDVASFQPPSSPLMKRVDETGQGAVSKVSLTTMSKE